MGFDKSWSIDCPKCQRSVAGDTINCGNCGNVGIKVNAPRDGSMGVATFGCNACQAYAYIECPDCDTLLNPLLAQKYNPKPLEVSGTVLIVGAFGLVALVMIWMLNAS